MKGAYGDPENTGVGYNAVLTELGNHDVPQGWIQTPRPNTTPNTNPGPPVSWNDPSNPDDPQAGYGTFQTTPQKRRPSSITVTTSAQRLTSQMTTPTSRSMMLTYRTANCWSMSATNIILKPSQVQKEVC